MLVLVSPTKTQKPDSQHVKNHDNLFEAKKGELLKYFQSLSKDEIRSVFKGSEKIIDSTYENYQSFSEVGTAIFTYKGLSFQNMHADRWSAKTLLFADKHMLILSALYGAVRPLQAIGLYRLDFLSKTEFDLYAFWKQAITEFLNQRNETIINLASNEYSAMIDRQACKVPIINIHFGEHINGNFKTKATYSKISRGLMVESIMTNQLDEPEDIKKFNIDGFFYDSNNSTDSDYYFCK